MTTNKAAKLFLTYTEEQEMNKSEKQENGEAYKIARITLEIQSP